MWICIPNFLLLSVYWDTDKILLSYINLENNTCVLSSLWFLVNAYLVQLRQNCFIPTVVIVDSLSCVWLFATPWTAVCQASLSYIISWSLLKLMWCPLSWRCHPSISSSVAPFFCCLQSVPASESLSVSWLFTSGGQTVGASASASVLPMNISFMTD